MFRGHQHSCSSYPSVVSDIFTRASGPLAATLTYDTLRFGEFEDFPETSEPVWILGKEYSALTGGTMKRVLVRIQQASHTLFSVGVL